MATLISPSNHSPAEDAEALWKAVKGWGADGKGIIAILGHRNATQRTQIRQAYHESELSGDFERAMYRWILEPAEREALLANIALRNNANINYHVILEISCVLSPEELFIVRRAYHNRYKRSLEEDVAAKYTTGHLRQLLVGLSSFRYGGNEINARLAQSEADVLHEAIKDKNRNHEEVIRASPTQGVSRVFYLRGLGAKFFCRWRHLRWQGPLIWAKALVKMSRVADALRILTTRSKPQLVATFNRYRDDHGIAITKKLSDEGSDEFRKAVQVAISCINDSKKYYEKVLRNAIETIGTDEDALTRVIVTRAEKDLKDIKEVYFKRNSVHLEHVVAKETSGDYKNFLLTLMGKED